MGIQEAFHKADGTLGVWQAAAWYLERRYPDRWGLRTRLEHSTPDGRPMEHTVRVEFGAQDLAEAFRVLSSAGALIEGELVEAPGSNGRHDDARHPRGERPPYRAIEG